MAWFLVNPEMYSLFASLGTLQGDNYQVNDNCLDNLTKILENLTNEDRNLRTFRRAICFGQNIKKDLLPLLIHVKDKEDILNTTVKILVNLTVPVECLLFVTDALVKTDVGRHTVFELNRLLTTCKEACCDARVTKAILDHIKRIIDYNKTMTTDHCDGINNCLLLLRNILHIPATENLNDNSISDSGFQNKIIWNLFTQSIDKILLHLITHKQLFQKDGTFMAYWGVTIVQLIALMYKDQHVGTLHKLLNLWFEASLSDSSDDNESNTSPTNQGSGGSSPMLTSTSDSSDNGGSTKQLERVTNEIKQNTSSNSNSANNSRNSKFIEQEKLTTSNTIIKQYIKPKEVNLNDTDNINNISSKKSNSNMNVSNSKSFPIFRPKGINACMKVISDRLEKSNETNTLSNDGLHKNNAKNSTDNKKLNDSPSEVSDCGYGTQMEKESLSTSSNSDDTSPCSKPIHQKPTYHNIQKTRFKEKARVITIEDKNEIRRKKLVKRSKTHIINMKGLIYHVPTDEDISNILKEFTVDFLLKGYNCLVDDLYTQLLTDLHLQIDTSHFFWLVTYFLKFATQLELDLGHVHHVLSYNIVAYLIYEGINLWEQLEIASKELGRDLKPFLRRLHLVVTAIREFLQTLDTYQKMQHLSQEDKDYLKSLQNELATMHQLKWLFILLIRQYNPKMQSLQYLQDLIVTNHNFMVFLDRHQLDKDSTAMSEHIEKFATVEIMHQYGLLLENFQNNGEYVNNCVFTMMHHVAGDIKKISTLFQPVILKTFSQIWETDYNVSDDWSDLIEYVINKFISTPKQSFITPDIHQSIDETLLQSKTLPDNKIVLVDTSENLNSSQIKRTNKIDNNIMNENTENIALMCSTKSWETKEFVFSHLSDKNTNEINKFKELLLKDNCNIFLSSIQKLLIDACFVKLKLRYKDEFKSKSNNIVLEPIPYYYIVLNKSIPIVMWNTEEAQIYQTQSFILFMQKLGFDLPNETGNIFVRIPATWSAEMIFTSALKLGPIDTAKLNFDIKYLESTNNVEQTQTGNFTISNNNNNNEKQFTCKVKTYSSMQTISMLPFSSIRSPPPNWLHTVMKANTNANQAISSKTPMSIDIPTTFASILEKPPPLLASMVKKDENIIVSDDQNDENDKDCVTNKVMCTSPLSIHLSPTVPMEQEPSDISETNSIASDLTRMCVSDEDEKIELLTFNKKK